MGIKDPDCLHTVTLSRRALVFVNLCVSTRGGQHPGDDPNRRVAWEEAQDALLSAFVQPAPACTLDDAMSPSNSCTPSGLEFPGPTPEPVKGINFKEWATGRKAVDRSFSEIVEMFELAEEDVEKLGHLQTLLHDAYNGGAEWKAEVVRAKLAAYEKAVFESIGAWNCVSQVGADGGGGECCDTQWALAAQQLESAVKFELEKLGAEGRP